MSDDDSPGWQDLAARGRALAAQAEDREAAAARKTRAGIERRLLAGARLTVSPLWFYASPVLILWLPLVVIGPVALVVLLLKELGPPGLPAWLPPILPLLVAGPFVLSGVLWLAAWLWGGTRLERERRWLEGLPFPVERHLFTLGYFDKTRRYFGGCDVTLQVDFADDGPLDEIADACRGYAPALAEVSCSKRQMDISSGKDLVDTFGGNRPYYHWSHRMIDGFLRPLAARRQIARVIVRCKKLGATRDCWTGLFDK